MIKFKVGVFLSIIFYYLFYLFSTLLLTIPKEIAASISKGFKNMPIIFPCWFKSSVATAVVFGIVEIKTNVFWTKAYSLIRVGFFM